MENIQNSIPGEANSWLISNIGDYKILGTYHSGSPRTGVWRIQSSKGVYFYKVYQRRSRWGTEVYAYKNWTCAIDPFAPKLEAVLEGETNSGILITEMPGTRLSETVFEGREKEKAYFKAGELLRRFHESMVGKWFGCVDEKGLPIDWSGDPLSPELLHDLPGQKRDVLNKLLQSGDSLDCFGQSERQVLQWAIESSESYSSEKPIPTSEDYTPGNWLVDAEGNLTAIIDFENMLWGDRMFPFSRLINDYFLNCPNVEKSFYDGYGRCPPHEQPIQAGIACAIYAGHYVILGYRMNHEGYVTRGKAALRRIILW